MELLKVVIGSRLYGYANPESDYDYIAVTFPGISYYFSNASHSRSQQSKTKDLDDESDVHSHELLRFLALMTDKFNPNVAEALWAPNEFVTVRTPEGDRIREQKDIFISQRFYKSLIGYAMAQRSRMLGENRGKLGKSRKHLIDLYGYDTKYAAHAMRLLWMGKDFMLNGVLNPIRPEAEELAAIRTGKYKLPDMIDYIDTTFQEVENLWPVCQKFFPEDPDYKTIDTLSIEILSDLCYPGRDIL